MFAAFWLKVHILVNHNYLANTKTMLNNPGKPALTGLLTSLLLLGIICLVNLSCVVTYILTWQLSPYLFPFSIVAAIWLLFSLAKRLEVTGKQLMFSSLITIGVLVSSLAFGCLYFDLSWDGEWYHQAAVYNLSGNWNPFLQPMTTPDQMNISSVLYFPKNSWFFGAAVLRLFGTVEPGKAYNLLLLPAAYGVVYALCRDFKMRRWQSIVFTLLVILNPVVWSEVATFLNDGDLYLSVVIYVASVILWLRKPKLLFMLIGAMSAICLINLKFTGLVFFLVSAFSILIYILIRERQRVKPFLLSHITIVLIAVGIFGYNPYVTNMINRGNPLYPIFGSKAYPSVFVTTGRDANESETPRNMKHKNLPVRLFYATFSRPGNAPYNKERRADLANPLTTSPTTWTAYQYHETRVSGFGPYFSIALVFAVFALIGILIALKKVRVPTLIFVIGLCCCMSLSQHFWWPRFFPMFWLVPLLPLFLLLMADAEQPIAIKSKRWPVASKIAVWLLVGVMAINSLIVGYVHMQWETSSSIILRTQLENLSKQAHPIEIDYGKFKGSMEPKLNHWGIRFIPVSLKNAKDVHKLMSVVKGYPNQVLYRVVQDTVTK